MSYDSLEMKGVPVTISDELAILSRFEHLQDVIKTIVSSADDRLLKDISCDLDAMQISIWVELDRRAGKPWARSDGGTHSRVMSNTAKFAF
jgi:hypothetical protein